MSSKTQIWKSALLRGASFVVVAAALGGGGQAWAQTAPITTAAAAATAAGDTVSDVVVTAERRSTTLQKLPAAVTAVTTEYLNDNFVNEISSLNAVVPSLEITKTSGSENLVTIRGVGSETPENSQSTSPGVSLIVDGVYIVSSLSLDQTLFDLSQVEVLRGPQGDEYAESSIGGAIILDSKQPQLHSFSGAADFSAGDYALSRERVAVNIPVGDDIAIRISAQKYDHNGFTNDVAIPGGYDEDDAHDHSGKVAVLWKPSDQFSATLTAMLYKSNQHGDAQKNINDPESNPWSIYQDYPGQFNLETQLYHLNLNYDNPLFTVHSVTGYQNMYHNMREDSSRSAYSLLGSYDDVVGWTDTASSYTQELDFLSPAGSKLDWIFGGFFLNNKTTALTEEFEGTANPNLTPAVLVPLPNIETKPPGNLAYGNTTADTHVSASGFGRLTYHITPQWSVAAGARINYDRSAHDAYNFSEFDIDTVGRAFSSSVATWKFFTAYDITPSNSVYAWVARGYKPGGVNGTYGQVVIPAVFQPETNDGFEVGSKNFFLDHTLQLNIAAYYYLYKNFQYIEQDPVPFDGGMSNIPNIHNYGAEFEAKYRSEDGKLHLDGSIALEDGKVIGNYYTIDSTVQAKIENGTGPCAYGGQYYNPACWNAVIASARNINGKTPPAMPKESGSLSAAYDYTTQWGMLTPRATVIYRGQEWARIFNEPALDNVPAYTQLNLTVTFVPTRSNFKFMLTSTNVTNVAGINSQYTDPYGTGQTSRQYIRPRQVIGTVAYSF